MAMKDDTTLRTASPQAVEAMEFTRRRRVMTWANVALMVTFTVGTVVMLNVISREHGTRFNWTAERIEELSDETVKRLGSIDREVSILLNPFDLGGMSAMDRSLPEAWRLLRAMLGEFTRRNPRIKLIVMGEGEAAQTPPAWMTEFGGAQVLAPNTLYLFCRGADGNPNTRMFHIRELYIANPGNTGQIEDFFAEQRLISALWTMTVSRKRTVYFTEGHDEVRVEDRRDGMSTLLHHLRERDNVEFKRLNLESEKQVPRDAEAVLVAGPRKDFMPEHLDALRDYLETGGRVMVAIDPSAIKQIAGLRRFLDGWGARVDPGLVIDYGSHVGQQPLYIRVRAFERSHPINKEFATSADAYVDVPLCAAVRPPADSRQKPVSLIRSSKESWQDINGNGKAESDEPRGLIDLAVAVEGEDVKRPRVRERAKPKLLVWGSVQAFTNNYNRGMPGVADLNMAYFLNNFRWLLEMEQVISGGGPTRRGRPPVDLNDKAHMQIMVVSIFVLPALGVILGICAWWFRRK